MWQTTHWLEGMERVSAACTGCHADIAAHSTGAKVKNVTAFRPGNGGGPGRGAQRGQLRSVTPSSQ
jgi:hypothetical protein